MTTVKPKLNTGLTRVCAVLLLHFCVQSAFAQSDQDISDSYRRLTQAVSKARGGQNIQAQTTDEELGTNQTAGGQQDQQLGALAKALSAEQTTQREQQRAQQQAAAESQRAQEVQQQLSVKDEAFIDMTGVALPLSPERIKTLKRMFNHAQRAAAEHPGVPPKPTSSSIMVNLAPGATPPIIRLSAGFVSSLVFIDATGSPWPIAAWDLGDPRSYNIQWDKKGGTNTLMVQAVTSYKSGNLAVMLKGMHTPVMLTLLPGQKAVDYRVDLRLPGLGPNATTTVSTLPTAENTILLNTLNGVPPMGAKKLRVSGGPAEMWLIGDRLFVRTRLTILSPGWISTMSSADGLHAYEVQMTPLMLASFHGKMVKLVVEGL